jgi:HD-like signal output (HDOD) protein
MDEVNGLIEKLPALPVYVLQVQKRCRGENCSIAQLVEAVKLHPPLAKTILRVVNSPFYTFDNKIESLSQAIALVGRSTIEALTISYGVSKTVELEALAFGLDKKRLLKVGLMQSALTMHWVKSLDESLLDDIMISALLSDVGKLILSQHIYETGRTIETLIGAKSYLECRKAEKGLTKTTTEDVSAALFDHWNLNQTSIEILQYLSGSNKAVDKRIKRMALILMIVKVCINTKQQMTPKSKQNALALAKKYRLEGLKESIEKLETAA